MSHWSNPDILPAQDLANMVAFIEECAQTAEQQRLHTALVTALDPRPGERLLDGGCGTGSIARRLAPYVTETGSIIGVDISNAMVEAARTLGHHAALQFEQGSMTTLSYEADAFDGATAARLLLHVADHQAVLTELRRVVRPGGRLALLEWDWGTLAIDHSDRTITRRILDWRCDNYGGNNWMGRQLVRRCMEAGWKIRHVEGVVTIIRDQEASIVDTLRRASKMATDHDIITTAEQTVWLNEIEQRLADGTFFATINDYIVIAD